MPDAGQVLKQMKDKYPGREAQLDALSSHIALECTSGNPILVHGPPGSGKTSVVRDLLASLHLRHAYINCNYAARIKTTLASILHQIKVLYDSSIQVPLTLFLHLKSKQTQI